MPRPSAAGIRAGSAYVELALKSKRLIKGLNAAAAKLKAFGSSVTALGKKLAAIGVTFTTSLLGAAKMFADMGAGVYDASKRTGVGVEALTELRYAAEQTGATAEDLEKSLRAMSRYIVEAARDSKKAEKMFARLGLTIADLSGLSPDEQFELLADRLAAIPNPLNRGTIAMEIFGKTGANLLELFTLGAEGIRELRHEGKLVGATMSSEDAQAAKAFDGALTALWRSLKRVVFVVGGALAPTLQKFSGWVTQTAVNIAAWIDQNREAIPVVAAVAAGIVGVGAALMVLGPLISGIGAAILAATSAVSLLGAVIGLLLSPIGLVVAAVGGIAAAVLFATDKGNQALASLGQGFDQLLGIAGTTWQGIQDAIASGDLAGAMEVAWLGLQTVWETGIAALNKAWRSFQSFFVELFWDSVYAVARALNTAWTSIEVAFWTVVNALADGWDWFVYGLKIAFNEFVAFFRRAWARVRNVFDREAAQREIEAINREVERQNKEARELLDQRIQERAPRVDEARQAGKEREEALNQMQEEERRQRQQEIEAANAADQERVAAAQRALEEKAAELAAKRQQKELEREQAELERKKAEAQREVERARRPEFDLEDLLEGLDKAEAKMDVFGTFNVFALPGVFADNLAERTAKATERVAENTGRLVRHAQKGGLVFA